MVGDAVTLPVLKGTSTLGGIGLLDSDPYIPQAFGLNWFQNQNNFYRQVRNFVIDLTEAPRGAAGIHWQVAQATSLQNIKFVMRPKTESGNQQQGVRFLSMQVLRREIRTDNVQIFMENGSGGFMTDLVFIGGNRQMFLGNQQFTTRNLTFIDGNTAIYMNFNWLWTFHGVTITGCNIGIDMTSGGFDTQAVGSIVILDSSISVSTTGIITPYVPDFSSPQTAGTLVVENVQFVGTAPAIANAGGRVVLAGGQTVQSFAQGNAWTTAGEVFTQGTAFNGTTCTYSNTTTSSYTAVESTIQQQLAPIPRPSNLVTSSGAYFTRAKPQYEQFPVGSFLRAKAYAVGDGVTGTFPFL
jgi:glucan 1,3-beta-glucosidase